MIPPIFDSGIVQDATHLAIDGAPQTMAVSRPKATTHAGWMALTGRLMCTV